MAAGKPYSPWPGHATRGRPGRMMCLSAREQRTLADRPACRGRPHTPPKATPSPPCRQSRTARHNPPGLADGCMRASDQDRETTVQVLRDAYTVGRLHLTELRARAAAAWQARTCSQLRALTADLPSPASVAVTEVTEVTWSGRAGHTAAEPPPVARAPLVLVAALVCMGVAAAVWRPAVLIPLIILALPIGAAALCGGGDRPFRRLGNGPDDKRHPRDRPGNARSADRT